MSKIDYERNYEDAEHGRLNLPLGWEIGRPQDAVVRLAEEGRFRGDVLDAGCGTGEHALFLTACGHRVTGVDSSRRALAAAQAKAAERGLHPEFLHADAVVEITCGTTFGTVLDCGLLHSLAPEQRPVYADRLAAVCEPGASCFVLCFSDAEPPGWGPYRLTRAEVAEAMGAAWETVAVTPEALHSWRPDTGQIGPVRAWLGEFRRQ